MLDETIENLSPKEGGVYVDATFGGGGHSLKLLSHSPKMIVAFESDEKALESFIKEYGSFNNLSFVHTNFANIISALRDLSILQIDGLIADLGWSTDQLESLEGLSYQKLNDRLDMRFHKETLVQAKDILNTAGKNELSDMFARYANFYGKENDTLVSTIRSYRSKRLFETVADLVDVCNKAFGLRKLESKSRKHTVYSRVFQALRIRVNDEYSNLTKLLTDGFSMLTPSGRCCIISFHSGEEKIIEDFVDSKVRQNSARYISRSLEGNFLRPSVEELTENLRARSAKLYVFEKI